MLVVVVHTPCRRIDYFLLVSLVLRDLTYVGHCSTDIFTPGAHLRKYAKSGANAHGSLPVHVSHKFMFFTYSLV